jgi:hypothetical protein
MGLVNERIRIFKASSTSLLEEQVNQFLDEDAECEHFLSFSMMVAGENFYGIVVYEINPAMCLKP